MARASKVPAETSAPSPLKGGHKVKLPTSGDPVEAAPTGDLVLEWDF